MKIYITLENGNKRYYANKAIAKRNARKACRDYQNDFELGLASDEVEVDNVPTDKKGLIDWLNDNATSTGWSED
jgi:hypothetical protein